MQNPLALLSPELIEVLIEHGNRFFVRQSFSRGIAENVKEAFLVTHYQDIGEANAHFQAIRFDSRKYLYSVENAEEKRRLIIAAGQPEGYRIFAALLKEKKWRPPIGIGQKVKSYLRMTGINSQRNIEATLSLQFGELILNIQAGPETFSIPLGDIEKY